MEQAPLGRQSDGAAGNAKNYATHVPLCTAHLHRHDKHLDDNNGPDKASKPVNWLLELCQCCIEDDQAACRKVQSPHYISNKTESVAN